MSAVVYLSGALVDGLAGGAVIGAAAGSLLLLNGDVLGASGIVSSVVLSPMETLCDPAQHWKLVLLSSFLAVSLLLTPMYVSNVLLLTSGRSMSAAAHAIAGLLVGFGTRLGSGCTSGHGICGLARFSKRSLTAVLTFMATAIATVGLTSSAASPGYAFLRASVVSVSRLPNVGRNVVTAVAAAALAAPLFHSTRSSNAKAKLAPAAVAGALFAAGLYVSQMVFSARVFGFLEVANIADGTWDPTLAAVMGGGVLVSFLSYQLTEDWSVLFAKERAKTLSCPIVLDSGSSFSVTKNTVIDKKLLLGAAAFGIGWGIGGICPGPALFMAAAGVQKVLSYWWPTYFVGAFIADQVKGRL